MVGTLKWGPCHGSHPRRDVGFLSLEWHLLLDLASFLAWGKSDLSLHCLRVNMGGWIERCSSICLLKGTWRVQILCDCYIYQEEWLFRWWSVCEWTLFWDLQLFVFIIWGLIVLCLHYPESAQMMGEWEFLFLMKSMYIAAASKG